MKNKAKILIVEDERIIAEDIKISILNSGYKVADIVVSGKEAIKKSAELHPDFVLMDIKLKGKMDGIEAADIIFKKYNIPIIYLTANADNETINRAKKTNPYGFLVKPFEDIDIKATLETAFYKFNSENVIKRSEERFRKLIEENTDGIIVINKHSKIYFVNKAAELMFERKKEELIGEQIGFSVSDKELTELDIVSKSGKKHIVEMHIVETEWEKKKAYLATLRDITVRKQFEENLKESSKKIKRLMEEIVIGLTSTIEMRDPYTAGHQKRVSDLACSIAKEMNLSKEQIDGIRIAALIHDLGKIRVPSEILSKTGKLTDIEFEIIKSHVKAGYDILKNIEFPWPVAKIILQHHEKLNGTSYPNGLKKDEIILEAKIICVADVVEAMSSHRPYRPALGIDAALKEISDKRGILYDEQVVDACVGLFKEKGFRFEN